MPSAAAMARGSSSAPSAAAVRAESAPMEASKEEETKTDYENLDDEPIQSPPEDPAEVDARVRSLYYVMQSVESRLGGGEGVEGLYGSITRTGMARVLSSLAKHSRLDSRSHLVDVGAGLGRPLLHALADPGIAMASGVELDPVKCEKAGAFAVQARQALLLRKKKTKKKKQVEEVEEEVEAEEEEETENWTLPSMPDIQCCPVEALPSLEPSTHVYSFWEGVPPVARAAFGSLVAKSSTVRGVAVVQRAMRSRKSGNGGNEAESDGEEEEGLEGPSSSSSSIPEAVMRDYGFGKLELKESFAVSMSGSGRSFRAYVFSREPAAAVAAASSGASEQTALVATSADSPESKPRKALFAARPLPRACPLLAAAALAAERAAKDARKNGGSGSSGWKNITTPTKPSPLSSSRGSTPGSVSSSSSSATLLFSSSSSLCDREARRARRRAGLPTAAAAAPSLLLPPSLLSLAPPQKQQQQAERQQQQQQQQQVSIQSFCRVLRRAGVGGGGINAAAASPSKGSRLARSSSSSEVDASLAPVTISAVSSPAGKVLASPKKAGVAKKGGSYPRAAKGLGAALVAASAAR